MEFKQVEPGQGWLNTINVNFSNLRKEPERYKNIVLLNGWQKLQNDYNWLSNVVKYPMLNGQNIYVLQLAVEKDLIPNENGKMLQFPSEVHEFGGWPSGGTVPLSNSGHLQGFITTWFGDGGLSYAFTPMDGGINPSAGKTLHFKITTNITWADVD